MDRLAPGDDPDRVIPWVLDRVPGRFHLVGSSYGGATALLLATRHPERVASLALSDPAALALSADQPHSMDHIAALGPVFERAADPTLDDLAFSEMFAQASSLPIPDDAPEVLAAKAAHLRATRPPWTLEVDPTVPQRIPTLVIVGDAHPMYAEVGSALAAFGAEVVEHAGLGHRPHDDPGITERIRAHWLAVEGAA